MTLVARRDELDKLKKERLGQLEQVKSEPALLAQIAMQRKLLVKPKGHPMYTPTVDELLADLNAVTVDDVKAFHQSHYGASAADMAVAGDFDADSITAVARRLFGDWKNATPFAFRMLAPGDEQAGAEHEALWPLRRMPVLVDEGRTDHEDAG